MHAYLPAYLPTNKQIRGVCEQWGLPPSSVLIVGDSLGASSGESVHGNGHAHSYLLTDSWHPLALLHLPFHSRGL